MMVDVAEWLQSVLEVQGSDVAEWLQSVLEVQGS